MSIALIYPGQGSQYIGMLKQCVTNEVVKRTFDEASDMLKESVLAFDDSEKLKSTVYVQLSTFILGVAMTRALFEDGGKPDYVAGHSVGAFAAAVISGAVAFGDALQLVKHRAEVMESLYPCGYGMAAVIGKSVHEIKRLMQRFSSNSQTSQLYVANINSNDQVVLSGALEELHSFIKVVRAEGVYSAKLLNVNVPSHCPLMNEVTTVLQKQMSGLSFLSPSIPYVSGTNGRRLYTSEQIRNDLAFNASQPINWYHATTHLMERGVSLFIELPPGRKLTAILNNEGKAVRAIALEDSGISSARYLIHSV